jgi:hypothetical protein
VKAALTDQILIRNDKIWTARPRIDHVVIFQASAPRISNAAALIAAAVVVDLEDLAAIASAAAEGLAEVTASAAEDLAAVIALAVEDSVAAALAGSVAAVGADGNN